MQKIIDLLISIVLVVALITTGYYVYNAVQSTTNNVVDKPTYDYSTDEPINDNESFNDGERYLDFEFSSSYDPTLTGVKVTYIVDGWATDYVEPVNQLRIDIFDGIPALNYVLGAWNFRWCRDSSVWVDIGAGIKYNFAFGNAITWVYNYEDLSASNLTIGQYDYNVSFKYDHTYYRDDNMPIWDLYAQYINTFNFSYLDNTHNNLIFKFTIVGGSNNV